MDLQKPITVEEILKRPPFRHARIVAGRRGLKRPVRWVHVLEVSNASAFVNGHELILTTGVGLGDGEDAILRFVQQLVESRVSGLCIELVQRFTEVPACILEYAEKHDFPIIAFPQEVRFIDITQDLQSYIINRHHQQLLALEAISKRFLELTLQPKGTSQILKLLYQKTGCPVWLRDDWGTDILYPENIQRSHFQSHETLCQPIVALDAQVGSLHMIQGGKDPEYMQRLLDRAATAIAQELLRNMSIEERRMRTMQKWIEEWLQQGKAEFPEELVSMLTGGGSLALAAMGSAAHPSTPYESDDAPEDAMMVQIARMIHRAFKPYGLHVWMAPREEQWAVVIADQHPSSPQSMLQRIKRAFSDLFNQWAANTALHRYRWSVGISQSFRHLNKAPHYWKQAILALKVNGPAMAQNRDQRPPERYSLIGYDDLHAWQLFLQVDPEVLSAYVENQIGALLDYDRQNGTELVRTLEAYFATGQSKQRTAKALYIHRQTLYYRLEQISTLLGNNWDTPERRMALDIALATHRFLSMKKNHTAG
ncbi:MAG: PucR family transcriptional regulator [Planifilum sp.]